MKIVRKPAVAGTFYEANSARLRAQIEDCYRHPLGPGKAPTVARPGRRHILGAVVPHAGYMYSGPVACHSYIQLAQDGQPDTAVILGPNHTGVGSGVSIQVEGEWETPLGRVDLDQKVASEILRRCKLIEEDSSAQEYEHSVEVQVPMLQYLYGEDVKIVPIVVMLQYKNVCKDLASALAETLHGKNAVVVASSDFTHYEPAPNAQSKDRRALSCIEKIEGEQLLDTVERYDISMCGPGPVATMLMATKLLGASSCRLLKYATSGDVTGDVQAVVGYGAAVVA